MVISCTELLKESILVRATHDALLVDVAKSYEPNIQNRGLNQDGQRAALLISHSSFGLGFARSPCSKSMWVTKFGGNQSL